MARSSNPATTAPADTVLLDFHGLRDRLGLNLSNATIYRMVKDGRLPRPIRTGTGRTSRRFWRRDEVDTALAAWPRQAVAA